MFIGFSRLSTRLLVATVVSITVLLTYRFAAAQQGYQAPFIEQGLGATNITATAGNGRLTAGISPDGDLTVLSWPSPSYWDQLHYITTNAQDARERPRLGAPESAGAFAGVVVREQGAAEESFSWLRDWERNVTYKQEDVRVVQTTFTNSALGLEVVQYDSVAPERDVLVRRYEVTVTGETDYEAVDLVGYANLSPGLSKVPQIPLLDVLMDHKNDFLAVWDADSEAILHFHPGDSGVVDTIQGAINVTSGAPGREFGPIGEELQSEQPDPTRIETLASQLDSEYAEGVYAAMGAEPAPSSFQIGEDETDTCAMLDEIASNVEQLQENNPGRTLPADPALADLVRCDSFDPLESIRDNESWNYSAQDAFRDITEDAELSGDEVAGAQVNTALRVPAIEQSGESTGEASMFFAFGSTASEARTELDWARDQGAGAVEDSVVTADEAFVDDLWIPPELDGDLEAFVKRAFLNLDVGTDAETGAIVASISRQPSYQLDWPRDGAFFNTALDLAGQHDLVSKRMQFYSDTIRDEQQEPFPLLNNDVPGWPDAPSRTTYPPDSWEMNYYADGMVGGNIRLEIDNTALLIWAYVAHVGHLPESDREEYIEQVWPVVERATNFVASWRDPETGLMWPANEDDHSEFTQGLQGAETSYLALVAAARLAKHQREEELAEEWLHRAGELHTATMHYMYDEEEGFKDYMESGKAAGRSWLAWPARFLPYDDERLQKTTREILDSNLEGVRGNSGNGLYPTKIAIGAAIQLEEESERKKSLEIAERLASDIADSDTYTIGETYVTVDDNDDGETDRFLNAVSTPHLWSASLVYITTVAYHHPEKFDPYRDVLPEVTVPDVEAPGIPVDEADVADESDRRRDVGTDVAGGDASADGGAGESGGDDSGGDDGCNCATGGGAVPGGAGLLFLVAVGSLAFRRRRD